MWIAFKTGGLTVSEGLVTFVKPKDLALVNPELTTEASGQGDHWTVTLRAKHPALWTWLAVTGAEARYSDNFIHLSPEKSVMIEVNLNQAMSKEEFVRALQARSLRDTFVAESL